MEVNRQRLAARISTTLRAKQFLVFYAIVLLGIDFAVPLLAVWSYDRRSFADVFADTASPFSALIDAPGALSIALVLSALLVIAWLRCGYIRSIIGHTHFAPANALQFISMFGVLLITDLAQLGLDALARVLGNVAMAGLLLGAIQLGVYLLLLYADYAVVISGVDPITALRRSFAVVRANVTVSIVVMLSVTIVSLVLVALIDPAVNGTLARSAGLLVVRVVTLGAVSFVADVALIMVYVDSAEHGSTGQAGRDNG